MQETLGKRIAANRKRLGLTQDRLADLLGVTAQAVSKWENDQSCPDIQTLPRLAEIFGITTDALLGTGRAVETTVEPEQPPPTVEVSVHGGKRRGLALAVWLLIAGAVSMYLSIRNMKLPVWTVLWSSGLLTYGLFGFRKRISPFRLGCVLAGGYFLAGTILELPGLGWPAVLIVLGLLLLIRALQKQPDTIFKWEGNPRVNVGKRDAFQMDGEHFECRASFGEKNNRITLPRMSTGYASVSFGQMIVDLSVCGEIADGARVELDCSFGEVDLLVPSSCRAVSQVSTAFGDCSVTGQPDPDTKTTIYVNGNTSFGECNIRYI